MRGLILLLSIFYISNSFAQDTEREWACYELVCVSGDEESPEVLAADTLLPHDQDEFDVSEAFKEFVARLNKYPVGHGVLNFESLVFYQDDRPFPYFDEYPNKLSPAPPLSDREPEQVIYAPKLIFARF